MASSSVPAPKAGETPTGKEQPANASSASAGRFFVPKNSLLELIILMKQDMEGIVPFPNKFTRIDYLINLCFDTLGTRDVEETMREMASRPVIEGPWFLVDIDKLTVHHYARFVYIFTNIVFNPSNKLNVSVDGEDVSQDNVVPSSFKYMANCFNWMHAHCMKLTRMLSDIVPTWDTNADTALAVVASKVAADRAVYDAYLERSVNEHINKHMSARASEADRKAARSARTNAIIATVMPLVRADSKVLKTEAKKAGISKFGILMLALEFDDIAKQYMHLNDKERLAAKEKLAARDTAAAKTAPVPKSQDADDGDDDDEPPGLRDSDSE